MPTENWKAVSIPKVLMDKVEEEVKEKGFWASPSEFVRDCIKAKLNIYNFRFLNTVRIALA